MSLTKLTLISTTLAAVVTLGTAGSALAENAWERAHPRRDQVNDRLAHQNGRINQAYRAGELTRGQARQLHREDHQIRREERYMAAMNGGHITRGEQRVLNHQENFVSRQIGQ
jgi:hypothetical protein